MSRGDADKPQKGLLELEVVASLQDINNLKPCNDRPKRITVLAGCPNEGLRGQYP